jgi:DNA repair exonuclease SbcCD nuclease subunit
MQKPLDELKGLATKWNVPIFCAGDVFDRWNSSPELINWAMDHLPTLYAIPGQHDLPEHSIKQIEKSAYQTMVKANKIISLNTHLNILMSIPFRIWACPYGSTVIPCPKKKDGILDIAIIHEYNWIPGTSYFDEGLMQFSPIDKQSPKFKGYDFVFCGDNHIPFSTKLGKNCIFFNCGTLMRRHSNDRIINPGVWVLCEDRSCFRHTLNTVKDIYIEAPKKKSPEDPGPDKIIQLIEQLKRLKKNCIDFQDTINLYIENQKIPEKVKEEIIKAMEE